MQRSIEAGMKKGRAETLPRTQKENLKYSMNNPEKGATFSRKRAQVVQLSNLYHKKDFYV